jgi:antitoxin VapB
MDNAIRALQPGQTEHQIAARLASEAHSRGLHPTVNLIACDERVFTYRHPLPTNKTLERYAMLVLCGRRWGLVCSITRLVHFGALPDDLRQKADAVSKVDAAYIAATHPGVSLGEIFEHGINTYAEVGFPDEWRMHHQGGPVGYEPREFIATPDSSERVSSCQAYAWNPSITGTKSEDTIQVGEKENEILTAIPGWPVVEVKIGDQVIPRPAILVIT